MTDDTPRKKFQKLATRLIQSIESGEVDIEDGLKISRLWLAIAKGGSALCEVARLEEKFSQTSNTLTAAQFLENLKSKRDNGELSKEEHSKIVTEEELLVELYLLERKYHQDRSAEP